MRVLYFDGLKGLSAIIVLLSHFFLCFLRFDNLSSTPFLRLFFDGGMSVFIFIILSAFGICVSLDKQNVEDAIVKVGLKRYFRLSLPLVWPSLLGFLICVIGANYNVIVGKEINNEWVRTLLPEELAINQLTSGVAVGVLRGSAFINPLWMMKYIFWGTFIVIPLFCVAKRMNRALLQALFLLAMGILFYSESIFFASSIVGVLFYFFHNYGEKKQRFLFLFSLISLISLEILPETETYLIMLLKGISVIMIVRYGFTLQACLSSPPFLWLSKISYQLYLVHTIIIASFSSYLYLYLEHNYVNYLLLFFVSVLLIMLFALLFTKLDLLVDKKVNDVFAYLLKKKTR